MTEPPLSAPTIVARFPLRGGQAEVASQRLAESFDADEVAVAAAEDADGRWTVALYFARRPNEAAIRAVVALCAGADAAKAVRFDAVAAKDWVKASLAGLKPVAAGRFLVHGGHDRDRVVPGRIAIEIEAALAFGTGHHGTTRGCLLAFDALLKKRKPRRALDLGTGTGVLAIAAAKAARRRVLASDIDRNAVAVARGNARLNGVGSLVEAIVAGGLGDRRFRGRTFDLILANILVGPLTLLAAPAAHRLAPSGRILLSGLLPEHANAAISAYRRQGLVLERRLDVDNWTTLVMRRGRE
jgi:ribosomal protein L11 methyltransferase